MVTSPPKLVRTRPGEGAEGLGEADGAAAGLAEALPEDCVARVNAGESRAPDESSGDEQTGGDAVLKGGFS